MFRKCQTVVEHINIVILECPLFIYKLEFQIFLGHLENSILYLDLHFLTMLIRDFHAPNEPCVQDNFTRIIV